jgi:hypothetical protein
LGAYRKITRNANASAGSNYTTTSTAPTPIDATNLSTRIETSGAPMRIMLRGEVENSGTGFVSIQLRVDTLALDGGADHTVRMIGAALVTGAGVEWDVTLAPGSHVITPYWYVQSGTGKLYAQAALPCQLVVEETVRPNASND